MFQLLNFIRNTEEMRRFMQFPCVVFVLIFDADLFLAVAAVAANNAPEKSGVQK